MIVLQVSGMSCQHCVKAISQAIHQHDAQAEVQIDLSTQTIRIANSQLQPEQLKVIVAEEGYPVTA